LELLYIWVNNYKGVYEKQGFDFSGELNIAYHHQDKKLLINKNSLYIKDFFNPDSHQIGDYVKKASTSKVLDITAIIGENGAGKSTLLELVKEVTLESIVNNEYIVVFKEKRGNNNHIVIKNQVGIDNNEIKIINNSDYITTFESSLNGLYSLIYFSNIFDGKLLTKHDNITDLSTNKILNEQLSRNQSNNTNALEKYRFKETESQIRFIMEQKKGHAKRITFKLPERINFYVDDEKTEPINSLGHLTDLIYLLKEKIDLIYFNSHFQSKFTKRILEHIVLEASNYSKKERALINNVVLDIYINNDDSPISLITSSLSAILMNYENRNGKRNSSFYKMLTNTIELFKLINASNLIEFEQKGSLATVNIIEKQQKFEEFLQYYIKSCRSDFFINYKWRDLSSGEVAYLNFFSRFYYASKKMNRLINKKNIIILIDEGELYFHPQWQKEFIKNLVEYFTDIFKHKLIHMIITSNSPFIASDLPKSNIIFLEKRNGRTISVHELESKNQTFAANIHSLLSDSFFMKDGVIGSYAKDKINFVINTLVNKNYIEVMEHRNQLEGIISIIGEPIIKTNLIKLLEEKISVNLISIDDRLKQLENEIRELRKNSRDL
jgi:predicted ATPase